MFTKALHQDDVGTFALAAAITGPVYILTNSRLRNLLATGVRSPNGFADFIRARLLAVMVGLIVCGGIAATMRLEWSVVFVVLVLAMARSVDGLSDICHGLFQKELQLEKAAKGLSLNGIASVVFVTAAVRAFESLPIAVGAYALGSLVALTTWDLPRAARIAGKREDFHLRRVFTGEGSYRSAIRLLVEAFPLGLSCALDSLKVNIPRYVIAGRLGPVALGVFAALSYLPTSGNVVIGAVGQAALPVLARDYQYSSSLYGRRLRLLVMTGGVLGLLGLLVALCFGRPVLSLLYTPAYGEHANLLVWLCFGAAIGYTYIFLGTAATARHRFKSQLGISIGGLVVVTVTAPAFAEAHGLVGVAYSLIVAASVEALAYCALTVHDAVRPLRSVHFENS